MQLPPEIWRLILRQATYVQDLLSTTWDYSPEERIWQGWEDDIDGTTGVGMDTKRAIVQVCREWKDIGVEFIYESIHFSYNRTRNSQPQLEALVNAFMASAAASPIGHGYGWWTKRMSCPHDDMPLLYPTLFAVLEHCHNVQIFSIRWHDAVQDVIPPHIQVRLSEILHSRFPHSLRRIELCMDEGPRQAQRAVIPRVVGMTSLGTMVQDDTLDPPDTSSFNSITSLSIFLPAYLNIFPAQWNFPSLRNLSLQNVSVRDVAALIPFVKRHQQHIVHLHITSTKAEYTLISSLLLTSPNLRSLAFSRADLDVLAELHGSNKNVPTLTHIGVTDPLDQRDSLTPILRQIFDLGIFPNLAVIRLLDASNPIFPGFDWSAVELCKSRNVRLEDKQGQLISAEDGSLSHSDPASSEPFTSTTAKIWSGCEDV